MIPVVLFLLIVVLVLVVYLSAVRSVFSKIHISRQLQKFGENNKQTERFHSLLDDYSRVDTGLKIFQMMARFFSAGLLLWLLSQGKSMEWDWWVYCSLFGGALLLAVMEWAASMSIVKDPEGWALRMGAGLLIINQIVSPLVNFLYLFTKDLEEAQKKLDQVSEEELKSLVDEGRKDGILEKEESKMIHSVFRLDDTLAREIMVPRIDILAIEAKLSFSDAVKQFVESGFSRIPVYQDKVDDILGLLYAKDLLEVASNGGFQGSITELTRSAYFVPESKVINELLADMQIKRIHLAIVVDEYGGVAGIVTLEDIIEEIFGEIQDEYDSEETIYRVIGPDEYVFLGRIDVDDLNLILGSSLSNQEADTLGGLVYYRLGHVPQKGEVVEFENLVFTVEEVDEHRINKVRIKKIANQSVGEENQ
ncbi:MAG: transporter associated domain-containing protein [Anaerolineales bacterium]